MKYHFETNAARVQTTTERALHHTDERYADEDGGLKLDECVFRTRVADNVKFHQALTMQRDCGMHANARGGNAPPT